ncbi:hypothetical protein KR009_006680, partial [Drosophila setifemur]
VRLAKMFGTIAGLAVILCLGLPVQGIPKLFLEPNCGSGASPRIINGQTARQGAFPWMAMLILYGPEGGKHFTCGGSLINHSGTMLNACRIVRLGEHDRDDLADGAMEYLTDMAFRHNYFAKQTHSNDIAMLRLESRVTYSENVSPICVILDYSYYPQFESLAALKGSGWGRTDANSRTSRVLQQLDINRLDRQECAQRFNQTVPSSQICVGNQDSNLCNGDSGGPLGALMSIYGRRVFVQVGIASYTNVNCSNVSVLTDVLSHSDWIQHVLRGFDP